MSGGVFTKAKYEGDNGTYIYGVRVQPETLAAVLDGVTNVSATGTLNQGGSARVGGGNNAIGVKCRSATLRFTGTPPAGYAPGSIVKIPILVKATWDALNEADSTGTYLGAAVAVVGLSPEHRR